MERQSNKVVMLPDCSMFSARSSPKEASVDEPRDAMRKARVVDMPQPGALRPMWEKQREVYITQNAQGRVIYDAVGRS